MRIQLDNSIAPNKEAYITGDITKQSTKNKLYKVINNQLYSHQSVDILVATPPCQGISIANHFKKHKDIKRNSLVLQAILVAQHIHPKVIIFENVKRFLKTACTDINHKTITIKNVIKEHLGKDYNIYAREVNFKNYGANSSRPRTLVVCSLKKYFGNNFTSRKFFPNQHKIKTLKQVLYNPNLPKLPHLTKMGEIDKEDILHEFKPYRKDMRAWIHNLKQGQSAFDNQNPKLKPHHKNKYGQIVMNKKENSDKYTRQYWNKVAPAVHTRNDSLASQNTIHPTDDRVFSIRELMRMMNIPSSFKWSKYSLKYLNHLSLNQKQQWLKKNEMLIRKSIGEAVPPIIFYQIGRKVMKELNRHEN